MFCAKCGTQLNEGTKFCSSCGSPVQQNTETTIPNQEAGKKNSKKLPVIIGSIAAVVLICILVFNNLWAIAPKAYYGKLESRNKLFSLDEIYQKVVKTTDIKPFSKDVGITVTQVGDLGMLESILKDLEIRAQIDYGKGQSSLYASCKYMNNVLADAILYTDKDIVGIGLPVLYDRSFIAKKDEISKALTNITGSETDLDFEEMQELKKQLGQDIKVLDKAINRYAKLAFKNIPSKSIDISKGDGPVRIYTWNTGSAKSAMELKKYKNVELKFTERDLNIIADKVLSELQKDDEVLNIIAKYAQLGEKLSYGYYYEDSIPDEDMRKEIVENLKEEIEDAREDLDLEDDFDDEDEEIVVSISSIVDKKGNIVSRRIIFDNSNVVTINRFHGKDDLIVTEINISEGKLGLGDQIANLYIYNGDDYRGIRLRTEYEGTMELNYKRSEKGKNASGIDYGEYSAFMHSRGEQYIVSLKVDSKSSSKNSELYKLRLQKNGRDLIACNIQASELKNKSKMKFSKGDAIDLASADADELEEIFYSIGSQLNDTLYEMQRIMYEY